MGFSLRILFLFLTFLLTVLAGILIFYYFTSDNLVAPDSVSITPVTKEPVSLTLSLSSPDDNFLTFDQDLLIQGKTSSSAVIILSSNNKDYVLEPSSKGNFSLTLKLENGVNQLLVKVFDNQGNSKSEERTVYYSSEKI